VTRAPARQLAAVNSIVRLTYGVAALIAPSRPLAGKVPLAPDADHFPEARLFIRGFSAHQIAAGLFGLAGVARPDLRRPAMLLAAVVDLADITSALVEARDRSRYDSDLTGGIVFSSLGLVSALAGARAG
jgi:hypothetical protein